MGRIASLILIQISICLAALPVSGQIADNSATVYTIDPENSILRVYVGRAGLLSRLGHNHVIHTRELAGQIILTPEWAKSSARFSLPVDSFVVDDADERELAGNGYDSQPNASAIAGTRENMLGEDVLNASMFPDIVITATPATVSAEEWVFNISLQIQDNLTNHQISAQVKLTDAALTVTARFSLDHEDIGLSPFTAVGGTLRVAEILDFELHIVAAAI